MQRVGAGDAAACSVLVERHLPPIVAFAARMLADRAEAEDVAQETFLRLWRHAGAWRPRARLSTWLHRVAYNLCIDRLRRARPAPLDEAHDPPDPAPDAAAGLARQQTAAIIAAALAALPERQRAAIALVHYQELGGSEAAEVLGVGVRALESLLARGRRTLRAELAGRRAELLGEP